MLLFVCFIISFQSYILLSYTTTMPDTVIVLSIEYFVISIRPSRWWWFLNVNGQHTHVYLFLSLTHIPYWLADKQTHAQGERERNRRWPYNLLYQSISISIFLVKNQSWIKWEKVNDRFEWFDLIYWSNETKSFKNPLWKTKKKQTRIQITTMFIVHPSISFRFIQFHSFSSTKCIVLPHCKWRMKMESKL